MNKNVNKDKAKSSLFEMQIYVPTKKITPYCLCIKGEMGTYLELQTIYIPVDTITNNKNKIT